MTVPRTSNPLVSIITTVRNGEGTLDACIRSVIAQTYESWEMILVDDGSTDGTPQLAANWSEREPRIKIKSLKLGRAAALNFAASLAEGDFLAILDCDDEFHPRKLERQTATLQGADILYTNAVLRRGLCIIEHPPLITLGTVTWLQPRDLVLGSPAAHSSALIRRSFFERIGRYDVNRKSQIDYDLWIRAMEASGRMGILREPLTVRRIHEGQSFEAKRRLRYLTSSCQLSWSVVRRFRLSRFLYAAVIARFFLGLLPQSIRRQIRRTVS